MCYGLFAGMEGGLRRRANICRGSATLQVCDLPLGLHVKSPGGLCKHIDAPDQLNQDLQAWYPGSLCFKSTQVGIPIPSLVSSTMTLSPFANGETEALRVWIVWTKPELCSLVLTPSRSHLRLLYFESV